MFLYIFFSFYKITWMWHWSHERASIPLYVDTFLLQRPRIVGDGTSNMAVVYRCARHVCRRHRHRLLHAGHRGPGHLRHGHGRCQLSRGTNSIPYPRNVTSYNRWNSLSMPLFWRSIGWQLNSKDICICTIQYIFILPAVLYHFEVKIQSSIYIHVYLWHNK